MVKQAARKGVFKAGCGKGPDAPDDNVKAVVAGSRADMPFSGQIKGLAPVDAALGMGLNAPFVSFVTDNPACSTILPSTLMKVSICFMMPTAA